VADAPALEIRDLRFTYPASESDAAPVIDIGSLRLGRGEQMLLTGGSGTGKSTLLHLILGLMEPESGEVRVAGEAVHALHGAARDLFRGEHVGMVFQTFNLLHGFSALENVMAAMMFSKIARKEHAPRARALLEGLGIRDVHKEPERLSVGQQQRVAVARAVACDPVLVLADEPTASLDPENASGAIDLIRRVCGEKNAALLCVSHDPSMASHFERRVSLAELSAGGVRGGVAHGAH
jgi:putative ABC transport system ATP-binding protein